MSLKRISALIAISFGAGLVLAPSAQAATFSTNVTYALQGADAAKGDIWLNYIEQNGKKFNNFSFVNSASVIENTPITANLNTQTSNPDVTNKSINNTGAASTDRGDKASKPKDANGNPLEVSGLKDPTGAEIAAYLGNKNLNNMIDTEDNGAFKINLFFDTLIKQDNSGLDNLFFWERGMNSDLRIRAIDGNGNLVGTALKLERGKQQSAGYSINTTEISDTQQVGSWGVSLKDLGLSNTSATNGIKGIQIVAKSTDNNDSEDYNGPDFKVIARKGSPYYEAPPPPPQRVPEPSTTAALGLLAVITVKVLKKKHLVGV
ncbi:hypothetical protein NIES2100_52860 [Calothrix sp. NIES-2100]|uniref:exosortase-dependent surface protein XDP2 n=1 Tax=Calothrix sp. NIES-2100 TaxID=1954172 RepID=UPI000B6124E2|nr:hypothetical protein NIES2100_52860 [Calothrix sp. NIES-2100]